MPMGSIRKLFGISFNHVSSFDNHIVSLSKKASQNFHAIEKLPIIRLIIKRF